MHFARAVLERLDLASDRTLDAYEAVFHAGDPSGSGVLQQAAARAPRRRGRDHRGVVAGPRLGAEVGEAALRDTLQTARRLVAALEADR